MAPILLGSNQELPGIPDILIVRHLAVPSLLYGFSQAQCLYLTSMKLYSNVIAARWLALFLFFCSLLALSPTSRIREVKVNESPNATAAEKEVRRDEPGPNELFYYYHNYPDYNLHYDTYRYLLTASMAHDKAAKVSKRGLDFPWKVEGPGNIGGRVNTIAVNPVDTQMIFIGYAQGGIYRSADGGQSWASVFDDKASLSISDIEFDPQNPAHLWATTGDVNISGYYFIGAGIYESNDSGINWHYQGLGNTGILSKVAIDINPQYLYVGSMGFPAKKGNEKGIFRSTNGGLSWEKTLTIDDSTGIIDLVADRTKTGRVFATAWTRIRSNTIGSTRGPGTGVYRSDDFGATWQNVKNGLPEGMHSRTSVEITNDGTLFVSYVGNKVDGYCVGSTEDLLNIYKSTDAGETWDTIPTAPIFDLPCDVLGDFGWYFDAIRVNPQDPDDIFILGVDLYRTKNGGFYWDLAAPEWFTYEVHADKHVLAFSQDHIYLGTDGGAYEAETNNTEIWRDIENIPSTQFYRTSWNPHTPDLYYGGAQDNGTSGGNESTFNEWTRILGGDGFQPLFDPEEPDWIYALTQYGDIYFSDNDGINFKRLTKGLDGTRFWDMPFIASPFEPKILFCASDQVYKLNMNDSLRTWTPISPDLTKGILVLGNNYPAVTAIAQSPLDESRLYAGTQDGLIWTTANGGELWTNISEGTPGAFVTSIVCSTINPQRVIATFSGYRDNDQQPYIYRSDDAGLHWDPIGSDIPMMAVNNIYILPATEDSILIVGTDGGVYVSFNSGKNWDRVGSNMPYFPVYDIDYDPYGNKIIAATFARGIMTFPMDELELETTIQEPSSVVLNSIKIYPTVASEFINIEIDQPDALRWPLYVSLIDTKGAVVIRKTLSKTDLQRLAFNQYLPAGVYIVRIQSDQLAVGRQIIIQ